MPNENIDPSLVEQIEKLSAKYNAMGQDLSSYLDGLLHANFLTYWDYIHLDTLLSLQSPKTPFPDEKIFIIYHQITELYFQLIRHEQQQIIDKNEIEAQEFLTRIQRINRYFDHLIDSFDVMIDGMDKEQFLSFRMSLLPSSGFQSGQYRMIEISATDFFLLANYNARQNLDESTDLNEVYEHLYWKRGATELATGAKTLTLKQFEKKYAEGFLAQAKAEKQRNFRQIFLSNFQEDDHIKTALKEFDEKANVLWPLCHFKSASRYLKRDPHEIKATGGTNWQQYLPPRKQMIVFYPELWTEEELSTWGTSGKSG